MTGLGFVWKLLPGSRRKGTSVRKPARARLALEPLEGRSLMSANVLQTNLVSDLPGVAQVQGPHLVNPWGISDAAGSPFWVSDNNAGVTTLYNAPAMPAAGQAPLPPSTMTRTASARRGPGPRCHGASAPASPLSARRPPQ